MGRNVHSGFEEVHKFELVGQSSWFSEREMEYLEVPWNLGAEEWKHRKTRVLNICMYSDVC